ncbi:hypothetical protein [Allofrancisella frigidaquae]|uniref:Uncharacterized protein n=1 Tax=Allofrancisella frigidaquae TaxID=1085644 RepID=A0A6M3HRS7_9GAMM|nr:hypothetical protein [Allofrancisella frigidaquae]QIV93938.1 hypothetical protein E3E15_00615 [Allofrancisella frigidaquae]
MSRTYFNMDRDTFFTYGKEVKIPLEGSYQSMPTRPLRIAMAVFTSAEENPSKTTSGMCQEFSSACYALMRRIFVKGHVNVSWAYNHCMNHYYTILSFKKYQREDNSFTRFVPIEESIDWRTENGRKDAFENYEHIVIDPWITESEPYSIKLEHSIYYKLFGSIVDKRKDKKTDILSSELSKGSAGLFGSDDLFFLKVYNGKVNLTPELAIKILGGVTEKRMLGSYSKLATEGIRNGMHNIENKHSREIEEIVDSLKSNHDVPMFYGNCDLLNEKYEEGILYCKKQKIGFEFKGL